MVNFLIHSSSSQVAAKLSGFPQKTREQKATLLEHILVKHDPTQTFHKKITIHLVAEGFLRWFQQRCRASTKKTQFYEGINYREHPSKSVLE